MVISTALEGGCELFLRRTTAWLPAFQDSLLTLKTINRHLLFSYKDFAFSGKKGSGPLRLECAGGRGRGGGMDIGILFPSHGHIARTHPCITRVENRPRQPILLQVASDCRSFLAFT